VKLVVLLWIKIADTRGEPCSRESKQFGATQIEIKSWFQNDFEILDRMMEFLLASSDLDAESAC